MDPVTGERNDDGNWQDWESCEPDDCTTYDEQHGGAHGAGEEPCILKWNAMQTSIIEARELEAGTKPSPAASDKGGRL